MTQTFEFMKCWR